MQLNHMLFKGQEYINIFLFISYYIYWTVYYKDFFLELTFLINNTFHGFIIFHPVGKP